MADDAPAAANAVFVPLYNFENTALIQCDDAVRKTYMSRFRPQLWGDGDFQMNCAERCAFSKDLDQAMKGMKVAWAPASNASASHWNRVIFSREDSPEPNIASLLGVAGELRAFSRSAASRTEKFPMMALSMRRIPASQRSPHLFMTKRVLIWSFCVSTFTATCCLHGSTRMPAT